VGVGVNMDNRAPKDCTKWMCPSCHLYIIVCSLFLTRLASRYSRPFFIQSQTVCFEAVLRRSAELAIVESCEWQWAENSVRHIDLKCLFSDTSRGCNLDVQPSGIIVFQIALCQQTDDLRTVSIE